MKQHFFFDMDGTLTESRSHITVENNSVLFSLAEKYDVVIVSGAEDKQILFQIPMAESLPRLSQNGNVMRGIISWTNNLNWIQKLGILAWIYKNRPQELGKDVYDLVEDRGCQISYSLIGHHAPQAIKEAFDRGGNRRRKLLEEFPYLSKTVKTVIGGTTCIDFCLATKGENITRFINEKGWDIKDCLYVGDALFKGGNDESVIGIIDTISVSSPEEMRNIKYD